MPDSLRSTTRRTWLAGGIALAAQRTLAQPAVFPSRPITLVVAAPSGGPSDTVARMLAEEMTQRMEHPMVVDNKPGVSGVVAAEWVAQAPPDGHTLMLSWIGNATAPALIPRLTVDMQRDFVHITQLASIPNVLVTHPGTGLRTLADFAATAKARPGRLSYASAGNGSSGHLAMEMLKQRAGISVLHIPYRGGVAALKDVLDGRMDALFINQDAVLAHVQAGRLHALAITSATRSRLMPALSTVAESGLPGFEATAWAGLSAPRGTPAAVQQRLHAFAVQALQGSVRTRQEALGAQIVGSTPAAFTVFLRQETEKWGQVIRAAGIKPD
jgi:tripartite-type tricarboxylate transporter receptor subunit TctC